MADSFKLKIEFGAVPNLNRSVGGYLPRVWENDKGQGAMWHHFGFSKADAEQRAEAMAQKHAEKFGGDWDLTVEPRPETAAI